MEQNKEKFIPGLNQYLEKDGKTIKYSIWIQIQDGNEFVGIFNDYGEALFEYKRADYVYNGNKSDEFQCLYDIKKKYKKDNLNELYKKENGGINHLPDGKYEVEISKPDGSTDHVTGPFDDYNTAYKSYIIEMKKKYQTNKDKEIYGEKGVEEIKNLLEKLKLNKKANNSPIICEQEIKKPDKEIETKESTFKYIDLD